MTDIGWDFILSPSTMNYKYCSGECNVQNIPSRMFLKAHGQIRYVSQEQIADCNMSFFLKLQFLETSWEWNINITTELLFTFRIWGGGHVVHGWSWWRWKTGHKERNLRGHASYIMWMWLNMEECSIIDEEVHDEFISDKKSSVFETMIQLWLLIFKLLRYLSTK